MKWLRTSKKLGSIDFIDIILLSIPLAILHGNAAQNLYGYALAGANFIWLLAVSIISIQLANLVHRKFNILTLAILLFVFLTELFVNIITGLHINWFLFTNLIDTYKYTDIDYEIGLLALILVSIVSISITKRFNIPLKVNGRYMVGIALFSFIMSQLIYIWGYHQGKIEALNVKRQLAFFVSPHPYYIKKLTSIIGGEQSENPFAIARTVRKDSSLPQKAAAPSIVSANLPNILVIVADSLRSKDIMADKSLAPNLNSLAQTSTYSSFQHYSTSNCTHFSMYSLFSGQLPTQFTKARTSPSLVTPLKLLKVQGYTFATSEAETLDWYDTADTIFGDTATRHVVRSDQNRDQLAIENSLKVITAQHEKNKRFFHLTYLTGTHFPYEGFESAPRKSVIDQYHQAIQKLDQNLAEYFAQLAKADVINDTIIIITSDHGEEVLENGIIGHSSRLSNDQTQVPFIVLVPESVKSSANYPRNHTDVMPYLLDLLTIHPAKNFTDQPTILANCDYDYPNGFAVIRKYARTDFIYDDGFLYKTETKYSHGSIPEHAQATKALIEALK
jgi:membrane-anchored protein YejM (alkaline phosphatase superfamily)